jgi:hypothetical protein
LRRLYVLISTNINLAKPAHLGLSAAAQQPPIQPAFPIITIAVTKNLPFQPVVQRKLLSHSYAFNDILEVDYIIFSSLYMFLDTESSAQRVVTYTAQNGKKSAPLRTSNNDDLRFNIGNYNSILTSDGFSQLHPFQLNKKQILLVDSNVTSSLV